MKVLIETDRLQMREFCSADVQAVFEFSTHAEVVRYTGDEGAVRSLQDARDIISGIWQAEYRRYGYARYALVHKADDRVIGFCGVKYQPGPGGPDLGYRMLPEYWGQGLASEAASAVMTYAQEVLGLDRIAAEVVADNRASSRVLEKLGFQKVGTAHQSGFPVERYEWIAPQEEEPGP